MLAAPGSSVTGMKGREEAPEADGVTADDGVTASSDDGTCTSTHNTHTFISLLSCLELKYSFDDVQLVYSSSAQKHVKLSYTSPFLSCQGLGLTRSSASGGSGGPSPLTLDEHEESNGGTGEAEGHSAGRIMLAGIRAPTTASLGKHTKHQVKRKTTHEWRLIP